MKKLLTTLAVFLSLCLPIQAQTDLSFFSNYGGLNTKDSPILMSDNESPDCLNVRFTTKGAIVKRNGYRKLNTVAQTGADQITSFFQYDLNSGTSYAVSSSSTRFYKMDSLDGAWDNITGNLVITADKKWKFNVFKDTLYGTDNSDTNLIEWAGSGDASAMTLPTGITKARDILDYRNYHILFNVVVSGTAHPSRFYYSNLNTSETWTATDFVDVATSDGDVIVGALVLGSDLYIFKTHAIYQVRATGDAVSPFVVKKTRSHVGAVSTYAILDVNNAAIFPYYDGVYIFDGDQSAKISNKIDPSWNALSKPNLSNCSAVHYRELNQVWFSVANSSANDTIYVWDYSNLAWTKYDGIDAATLGIFFNSGDERIFHGDYAGFIYEDDTDDSDNATAINAYWNSKWFDFGNPVINKRPEHMSIVVEDSGDWELNVSYGLDFNLPGQRSLDISLQGAGSIWDSALWDTGTWGGESFLVKRIDLLGQGKFIQFKFLNADLGEPFTVYGYGIRLRPGSVN